MDLRLTLVNPAFERLTGHAGGGPAGPGVPPVHPSRRPARAAGRMGAAGEGRRRSATRSTGWSRAPARSAGAPARGSRCATSNGRQIGYLGTEFDITERKLAEEEMRLDTELFQAVIEVQQAVAAAGLDSATVMRVIAERSLGLTGASGVGHRGARGRRARTRAPGRGREPAAQREPTACPASRSAPASCSASDDIFTDPAHRAPGVPPAGHPLHARRSRCATTSGSSASSRCFRPGRAFSDRDAKALRLLGGLVGRLARARGRVRGAADPARGADPRAPGERAAVQAAGGCGPGGHLGRRRPRASSPTSTSAWRDLLGYQNGALLGRPVYDFLDATARAGAQRALGRRARAERATTSASAGRTAPSSGAWSPPARSPARDGAPVGTVGMVTDITERKRTEERLRRSAERLAVLHDLDQSILRRPLAGRDRARGAGPHAPHGPVPPLQRGAVRFPARPGAAASRAIPPARRSPPASIPLERLSPGEVLRRGAVRIIDDLAAVESPPRSFGSCAGRACAASSASRSWWTARPSAR